MKTARFLGIIIVGIFVFSVSCQTALASERVVVLTIPGCV